MRNLAARPTGKAVHSTSATEAIPGSLLSWLVVMVALNFALAAWLKLAGIYQQLSLPPWAPPAWIFIAAWSVFYLLACMAVWLIAMLGSRWLLRLTLVWFALQGVGYVVWMGLLLSLQGLGAAITIIAIWLWVTGTSIAFWRVSALAGFLLLPYLAWLSFAALMTFSMWQ